MSALEEKYLAAGQNIWILRQKRTYKKFQFFFLFAHVFKLFSENKVSILLFSSAPEPEVNDWPERGLCCAVSGCGQTYIICNDISLTSAHNYLYIRSFIENQLHNFEQKYREKKIRNKIKFSYPITGSRKKYRDAISNPLSWNNNYLVIHWFWNLFYHALII